MLEERKQALLPLVQTAVETFLKEHPDLSYYCFAFDCNAEYAEINLCFNTEADFAQTLERYQSGPYGDSYRSEEDILDLRYNPGDWQYQCFATFYVLEEEALAALYGEDEDRLLAEMMRFNCELLALFCKTDTFARIPKTENFRVLCIDHDEDVAAALERTDRCVCTA